jgi:hypothetical protein
MGTPKMLPWLARKAGLSDARAEVLWAQAALHASREARGLDSRQQAGVAVARLLELIEAEKALPNAQSLQATPVVEEQKAVSPVRGRWPYSLIVAMKPVSEDLASSPALAA